MPKIPLFEQTQGMTPQGSGVLAPAVPIDTRTFGMEALAAAKGFEQLGEAGKELAEMGLRMNKALHHAKQVDMLAEAGKKSQLALYDLIDKVQQEGGPETWGQRFLEEGQKIFDETSKSITDREVLGKYKMHWSSVFPLMHHGVTTKARDVQIHQLKANTMAHIKDAVAMYVKETEPIRQAQIKAALFGRIQGGVSALLFRPDEAEQMRQAFDKEVAVARVKMDIDRDPLMAQEKLKDPEKHYPGLPPGAALDFHGEANAELHRRQQEKRLEVDQLYTQKKLSIPQLQQWRDAKEIDVYTYRFYEAAIQRDLLPGPKQTDPDVFVAMKTDANNGVLNDDRLYHYFKIGKLEKEDVYRLQTLNRQIKKGEPVTVDAYTKRPGFKWSVDKIEYQLSPIDKSIKNMSGEIMGKARPKSVVKEAAMAFLEECRKADERGELTNEYMDKLSDMIIKAYSARHSGGMGGQGGPARQTGIGVQWQEATPMGTPAGAPATPSAGPGGSLFNPTKGPTVRQQQRW